MGVCKWVQNNKREINIEIKCMFPNPNDQLIRSQFEWYKQDVFLWTINNKQKKTNFLDAYNNQWNFIHSPFK